MEKMDDSDLTSSIALNELDEQLTCSVCLDKYTNPKTLPCHHSFCLDCIERLPQQLQVNTHSHTFNSQTQIPVV